MYHGGEILDSPHLLTRWQRLVGWTEEGRLSKARATCRELWGMYGSSLSFIAKCGLPRKSAMTMDGAPSAAEGVPEGAGNWPLTALPTAGTVRPPLDGPQRHIPVSTTVRPLAIHSHLFIHIEGASLPGERRRRGLATGNCYGQEPPRS